MVCIVEVGLLSLPAVILAMLGEHGQVDGFPPPRLSYRAYVSSPCSREVTSGN